MEGVSIIASDMIMVERLCWLHDHAACSIDRWICVYTLIQYAMPLVLCALAPHLGVATIIGCAVQVEGCVMRPRRALRIFGWSTCVYCTSTTTVQYAISVCCTAVISQCCSAALQIKPVVNGWRLVRSGDA